MIMQVQWILNWNSSIPPTLIYLDSRALYFMTIAHAHIGCQWSFFLIFSIKLSYLVAFEYEILPLFAKCSYKASWVLQF
jgi:hypothetical protein